MSAALSTHQLSKDYGDRPALLPLDLEVPVGQHVALVGHNGSGKTTLLRMAAGLLDPSGGEARIGGHLVGHASRRGGAQLAQRHADVLRRPVAVGTPRVRRPPARRGATGADNAEELLAGCSSTTARDDIPTTFSRGLRQKAAIAIALVRPFEVLLVDEPFVGLDAGGQGHAAGAARRGSGRGRTLLVATHELAFVDRVQRLLALRDGALVYDGAPDDTDVHTLVLPA